MWNRTLAARRTRWHLERRGTSYAASDRALTAMKKDPDLRRGLQRAGFQGGWLSP